MDGNATRGMLGGGPASQHPRMQSQQIRGALPRTVTPLSSRYPQLLCVLERFCRISTRHARARPGHPSNLQSQMDRRIKSGDDTVRDDRAARAARAGLTILQRGAEFCTDPEQAERDQQKWNPVFASDRAVKNIEGAHDLIAKPL